MKILVLMMLLVGCGHSRYVEIDKPNYKRFKHDHKVLTGDTQEAIMEKFGTPDYVLHKPYMGKGIVAWQYYRKIFCSSDRCYVYFDSTGRVMMTHDVRMEFDPTLVNLR